jgi:hypothetical protein
VACDFFTVPTARCKVLFVFILLAHERRRIRHFHITEHPTMPWTSQQIAEAFPWETAPRYVRRDRDTIYSAAFQARVKIWLHGLVPTIDLGMATLIGVVTPGGCLLWLSRISTLEALYGPDDVELPASTWSTPPQAAWRSARRKRQQRRV